MNMNMNIQPLGEAVLVKVIEEHTTPGGIIQLSDSASTYNKAQVLAIGDAEKIKVAVGDIIMMPKEAKGFKVEGLIYLINYLSIVAKIN